LAPDFVEVEENVEYVEAEDEFDIQPPEELTKRRLDLEDEEVDVLTMDPPKDRQFRPGRFTLPLIMNMEHSDSEDDVVAIGAGQYRRRVEQDWAIGDAEPAASDSESKRGASAPNGRNGQKRKPA
jgi:COMPASS component SWD1